MCPDTLGTSLEVEILMRVPPLEVAEDQGTGGVCLQSQGRRPTVRQRINTPAKDYPGKRKYKLKLVKQRITFSTFFINLHNIFDSF